MKPLLVTCPCCGVELDVDRRSGQIVRTGPKLDEEQSVERFDSFVKSVKKRSAKTADAFDQVTEAVRGRERGLDDAFQNAFRRVKETDDGKKPFNPLDFD